MEPETAQTADLLGATARAGPGRAGPSPGPEAPSFPVPGWERYQPLRFLGRGGMGLVFLARDPRLHREVAIKLVRDDAPEMKRRLVLEARAQARIDHERVCKVYEVGEVAGQVYIAMQYIPGRPLGAIAEELHLAEKVMIVREAAAGAHAAHRAGILHRDIKPSNILVTREEDGSLRPFVVDFGLAQPIADGATLGEPGAGTPHYMSPEQARGETRSLDRRADVYSLGATLYHLLAGEPPITGENALDVLSNIARVEPRPLRDREPSIPADLDAIVLRCLEKDRSLRYDSARALALDLDRFLNGEPVEARRAGLLYRLRKRVSRSPRAALALGAASVLALAAVGSAAAARRDAAGRERAARLFTQKVERIEALARYSGLAPLHDTRPDRQLLRAELDALEAEIHEAGPTAAGHGLYALGRGLLALGEEERAREHLEAAWARGYREPRVAHALAVALGSLYQRERLEAERLRDPRDREARRQDIARRYRDPALAYMEHAAAAEVPSPELLAAQIASYEDRLDDALRHLDALGATRPWLHEAPLLRGDVLATRASRRWNAGDRAGALSDFEAGRRAYAEAAAIGESVPAVHLALGELEYALLVMELYGAGDVAPAFERGTRATSRALAARPDHPGSLLLHARFHRRMAEHLGHRGEPAGEQVEAALTSAERALAASPGSAGARLEIARCLWQRAQSLRDRGQDPRESLRMAASVLSAVPPGDVGYEHLVHLGLVFEVWADHEDQIGEASHAHRGRAIDAYRAATALDARPAEGWLNLGNGLLLRASHAGNADPDADLSEALTALAEARARSPEHIAVYMYSGQAHELLARRARTRGGSPEPDLDRALDLYQEGLRRNPGQPDLHDAAGAVFLAQAREAWDRGADPAPLLRQAQAAFEEAIAVAPERGAAYHNAGEVLAQLVQHERASGEDPGPTARVAIAAIRRAIERLPGHPAPHANLAMVYSLLAEAELEQGHDPEPSLALASAAIARALEYNPAEAQAHLYLAETRLTRARLLARRGRATAADFDAAAAAYREAIELRPGDQDYRLAFGFSWLARAEWERAAEGDPEAAARQGLSLAEALLAERPRWPGALVLRASLLTFLARSGAAGERPSRARQAARDFEVALAENANLEGRWRDQATLAQRLAASPP